MISFLFLVICATWSFSGIFIWIGMADDVKRWYKKLILLLISGPFVWAFWILMRMLITIDSCAWIYTRFEKWMKE